MTKHMHRTSRSGTDRFNRDRSKSDEWAHIINEIKQQQKSDPLAPKERMITFSNRFQHTTKEDEVREKSKELKDQMADTDQYFKFANGMIKERVDRLKQIKEDEKRFMGEVNLLQNKIKTRYEIDKIYSENLTTDGMQTLISALEEECEKMKDRLLYQELIVQRTKDEIAKKREQINKVKQELQKKLNYDVPVADPITLLKEELRRAGLEDTRISELVDKIKHRFEH